MRICAQTFCRVGESDQIQQLQRALAGRTTAEPAVNNQGFPDLALDRVQRIQGGHGFLKNHAHLAAAKCQQLSRGCAKHFFAGDADRAAGVGCRFRQELQDRQSGHRFS